MKGDRSILARVLVGVTLLSSVLVGGCGSGDSGSSSADPGVIVFTRVLESAMGPNAEVFIVNPDGRGETNLSNFPGTDAWAAWSPDKQKIAFTSSRDGNFEIYVMNADGSSQTRLTNNPAYDYQPNWSPDGTKIVFTSLRDGNAEIYVMNADGSGQRNLTNSSIGNDLEPDWSPDGTQIAFTSDRDMNFEIYLMSAEGGPQRNLTNNPHADTEPDWSPDGARFVFTSNRSGNGEIWIMTAQGQGLTQLTFETATDLGPAWDPDGTRIVYTSVPRPGQDEIFIMNDNGSGKAQITMNMTGDFLPAWQRSSTPLSAPLPPTVPGEFVPPPQPPVVGAFNSANVEGGGVIVFNVGLSAPTTQTVTVSFLTNDAPPNLAAPFATASATADYVPRSGLLIFNPGETFKLVFVPIIQDGGDEPNEVFANIMFLPTFATVEEAVPSTVTRGDPAFGKITNQALPSQPVATVQEFELLPNEQNPANFVHVGGMILGPDGNFWGSAQFDNKLVRFDPVTHQSDVIALVDLEVDGVVVPGPLPPLPGSGFAERGLSGVFPHFLTVGRDGKIWFTGLNDVIGELDVNTREVRLFRNGITVASTPHAILEHPTEDGVFYFAEESEEVFPEPGGTNKSEEGQSRLARFDANTRIITEFTGGLAIGQRLHAFNFDVDGNLWAGLEGPDQVVRFDFATATFVEPVQFSAGSGPHALYPGPPGDINLYVVLQDANLIGIFNPRTREVQEFDIPGLSVQDGASIVQFVAGPDNRSIWFTEFLNDRVGRFDLQTHQVDEFFMGISPNSAPLAILVGSDGALWFSEAVLNLAEKGRIGRIDPAD